MPTCPGAPVFYRFLIETGFHSDTPIRAHAPSFSRSTCLGLLCISGSRYLQLLQSFPEFTNTSLFFSTSRHTLVHKLQFGFGLAGNRDSLLY
jgi:hypothetical protein